MKREAVECNWIFSMYKDVSLLSEYNNVINGKDILSSDGQFYYGILRGMLKAGFTSVDNMSVYTYLEDKEVLKKGFESRGGWDTVQEILDIIHVENVPAYYDELVKLNMLDHLKEKGFAVDQYEEMFQQMTSEEVYNYYEYTLASVSMGRVDQYKMEDLTTGYEDYINEWDLGSGVGFDIASKMLQYRLAGVHRKNLLLHLAGIGQGKTSSAIYWYILPMIEKEDVCIVANEQDASEWRQMILATVLFNKIGNVQGFNRHKMMVGHYTEEQKQKMREAAKWLESQPGKIIFIETQNYEVTNIKKIMTRYSALGCRLFVVDTLKPVSDASDKSWGEFSDVAKELFLQSKKLDVAVIATCQLSPDAMSRRYLDLTCIAKAKAIAETASTVVMFRPLTNEEKKKIEPYNFDRENRKVRRTIKLDETKDYIMVFTPKNRHGEVAPQIIMERNMSFNSYRDVGWYECEYDQFRVR